MQNNELNSTLQSDTVRHPLLILLGCLVISGAVCYAHILGSTIVLALCLLIFLAFNAFACFKSTIFPVLLYFLPWSPLLKIDINGFSFFTFALLFACLFYFIKGKLSLSVYQIILTAAIVALTLIAKTIQDNSISNSYFVFIIMLLLFPCITNEAQNRLSFYDMTLFFSLGIIAAALSAQQVAGYPNISPYIKVDSYLTITRLSGYYPDPNFYSAHITACLAGVMLLLMKEKKGSHRIVLAIVSVFLLYCGLLSASKSFIVITVCLVFVWIPTLLEKQNRGSAAAKALIGALCAGAIVLSSTAFQELFKIIDTRFSYASNVSQLTTGRTDLWRTYINELTHNPILALFGEGFSSVIIGKRASHNTIIQGVFQFGLIGFPFLIAWFVITIKNLISSVLSKKIHFLYVLLMCVGIVLPWMALDILFFDELFLLPVYGALAVVYGSLELESGK